MNAPELDIDLDGIDNYDTPDEIVTTLDQMDLDPETDWPREYQHARREFMIAATHAQEYVDLLETPAEEFSQSFYEKNERAQRALEMAGRYLERGVRCLEEVDTGYGDEQIVPYGQLPGEKDE